MTVFPESKLKIAGIPYAKRKMSKELFYGSKIRQKFVEIRFLMITHFFMTQSAIYDMINVNQVITYPKLCRVRHSPLGFEEKVEKPKF
jgi:hypothetical protein